MKNKIVACLLLTLCLAGCGGKDHAGSLPPVATSVTVGAATITRTLQPGVIELADGEMTPAGDATFHMPAARTDITTGKIVTWKDQAFAITAVTPNSAGGVDLTVRPADYTEVLSDLSVKGDLDMSNFDVSRMAVAVDSGDPTPSVVSSTLSRQPRTLATAFAVKPCEGSIGDRTKGETSEVKCTIKTRVSDFELGAEIGVQKLFLGGVDVRPLAGVINVANLTVTPFIHLTASLLSDNSKPINIAKNFPLFYVQIPIASTYGFLHFDIPGSVDVSLPLFKFQVGAQVTIPYSNGKWSLTGSIDTPVATLGTNTLFKYDAKGHLYAVLGTELVLTKTPSLKPVAEAFKVNSPDRLLSTGGFFKGGVDGALGVNVASLQSKPCFTWSLQGKGGAAADVKLGSDPIAALSTMTDFGAPDSGSSGCEALGPSPGGFNSLELACKLNADGSAAITGLNSAELAPGEQITVVAWSTEYLTGMNTPNACSSPTYEFPDKRQFGIPGEYISSTCTPPDGLSLNPVSFAACHNPLSGTARNIWVRLNGSVSSTLAHGGSVLVSYCRATTVNLNGSIPPSSRPTISIDKTVACTK